MGRMNAKHRQACILSASLAFAALAFVACLAAGCASLRDRAASELDRIDLAAMLDGLQDAVQSGAKEGAAVPTPKPTAPTGDEIDLYSVAWHGPDVRAWPVASEMPQGAYVSGANLHFPHTKAGQWSVNGEGLEGNPWVVVQSGGQWHAATFEWLRKGQTSKPWEKVNAGHIKVGALGGYQLQRGEDFYVFVSGRARGAERGTAERTAARKVVWR